MQFTRVAIAMTLLAAVPACATDSHDYGRNEYAVIRDGLAPDRTKSLASHGDGEGGSGDFHIWLMAEPAHRRIVALEGIGSDNNLDTGPNSYRAAWSKDSRRVGVTFRSNRHVVELKLYRIEGRRAQPVSGFSLFKKVSGRDVDPQEDMRVSIPFITWQGPDRFVLREHRLFITSDPGFLSTLGAYGRQTEKFDDGKVTVEFSAEADAVLTPDNRYRIVALRAGKFSDPGSW